MNNKQKIAVWTGIIVIALMGLIPPWEYTLNSRQGIESTKPSGYAFILQPPTFSQMDRNDFPDQYPDFDSRRMRQGFGIRIDFSRLLIQWIIMAVITGGLIVSFKDQKSASTTNKK